MSAALEVDAGPQPDPGHAPTREECRNAIAFGTLPQPGETLIYVLATLLRIEDQIGAALAPATKPRKE